MRQLLSSNGSDLAQQALAYLQSEGLLTQGEAASLSRVRTVLAAEEFRAEDPETVRDVYAAHLQDSRSGSVALTIFAIAADSTSLGSGDENSTESGGSPPAPPQNISLADVDGAIQGAALGAGLGGERGAVIGGIVGGAIRSAAAKQGGP